MYVHILTVIQNTSAHFDWNGAVVIILCTPRREDTNVQTNSIVRTTNATVRRKSGVHILANNTKRQSEFEAMNHQFALKPQRTTIARTKMSPSV